MYEKLLPQAFKQSESNSRILRGDLAGVTVLHLDFVAKPQETKLLHRELSAVLKDAGLVREGLEHGLLFVADREARLVSLLTFWDAGLFTTGRERRIAWMQKLLSPFADGPVRVQISTPRLVLATPEAETADEHFGIDAEEFAGMAR